MGYVLGLGGPLRLAERRGVGVEAVLAWACGFQLQSLCSIYRYYLEPNRGQRVRSQNQAISGGRHTIHT
eukprot:scaffold23111_cov117-Isochrysis_galbana.AAC.3